MSHKFSSARKQVLRCHAGHRLLCSQAPLLVLTDEGDMRRPGSQTVYTVGVPGLGARVPVFMWAACELGGACGCPGWSQGHRVLC